MRLTWGLILTSLMAISPALADEPGWTDAQEVPVLRIDPSQHEQAQNLYWQQSDLAPLEKPNTDILAAKLGTAQGGIEIFRYHVDGVPNSYSDLRSKEYGGGLQLHITW